MRIGIDARMILNPKKSSEIGIGHYTYQLIRHLLEIDKKNQYILFFDSKVQRKDVKKFSKNKNVQISYFPWLDYKRYLPVFYGELMNLNFLNKFKLDVLHITSPDNKIPLGYSGKVVCTFQDLSVYQWPDLFSRIDRFKSKYNRKIMASKTDLFIAVSNSNKMDLEKYLKIDGDRITVVKNGVDDRFFEKEKDSEIKDREFLANKYKIKKDFILFTGTINPIKNIVRLLEAFRLFKENQIKDSGFLKYQLVISGKKGWMINGYRQLIRDFGLEKNVIIIGYVDGETLKKLFNQAMFFVMPSLYESSGMTVLEAMACKTPCLISEIDSLREVTGSKAEFVNPFDIQGLSLKIEKMLEARKRLKKVIDKGFMVAKKYSWKKCAKETLRVYRTVAKSN